MQQHVSSPHLIDFLSAVLVLFLPIVDFWLFSENLKRSRTELCLLRKTKHTDDKFHVGSCWMRKIRVCTSSLMMVRTACFSASLMQMESRTWLPVFCISLPPNLFFNLHGSSYCWGNRANRRVIPPWLLCIRLHKTTYWHLNQPFLRCYRFTIDMISGGVTHFSSGKEEPQYTVSA